MAKTCTYTILAPGGNLTATAQSDIYRYAVVSDIADEGLLTVHRDMLSAMERARGLMDGGRRAKVVEAVLTAVDGVPIPGAVEQRVKEKVDRLYASAERTYRRALAAMNKGDGSDKALFIDYQAFHRWIKEIKTQIKAV